MKALLVTATALGLLSASPAFAQAGPSPTANANASAEIVAPIAIVNVDGISFGRIASGNGGTVTVASPNNLSSSNPNMLVAGSTGSAATFDVSGANGLAYSSSVPATATLTSGTDTMTASINRSGGNPALSATGTDSFDVVGTLTVPAGQAAGNYTGSFTVSVQYN